MITVIDGLHYTQSHEWVRLESDGTVTVGISDHAQHALGDLVFVEVPAVGRALTAGEACAVVESVKAASDVYSPLAGTVTASNEGLANASEAVNQDPYGNGWLWRMSVADPSAVSALLSADQYRAELAKLGE